jgi:hypothetical protein
MTHLPNITTPYITNHLGIACSVFGAPSYESECFKELIELMLDDNFKQTFNYAIYCDDFIVKPNIFVPRFHTYYLNSETKDVIIMDEHLIDLPTIYNHHRYYIYNNQELFDKFVDKYKDIKHIKSIKDIVNVSTNE